MPEIPTEIRDEIFSQLCASSTSFRDLCVAFTCKELYSKFYPQIIARQNAILLDAIDQQALAFDSQEHDEYSKTLLRTMVRHPRSKHDEGGPLARPRIRGDLTLIVWSHYDTDLVWAVQNLLARAPTLKYDLVIGRFSLMLRSNEARIPKTILQECAASLGPLCLRAMDLVETALHIDAQMLWRVAVIEDEPGFGQNQPTSPRTPITNTIPKLQLSKLRLTSVPSPQLFPPETVDAIVQASSASLTELCIEGISWQENPWTAALDRWSFPQLSKFSIKDALAPISHVVGFLERHPSISTATFTTDRIPFESKATTLAAERMRCSALVDLTASPAILLHLLCKMSVAFPNLSVLKIAPGSPRPGPGPASELDDLTAAFSCIPATMPAIHTLSVSLVYRSDFHQWLADAVAPSGRPTTQGDSSVAEKLSKRSRLRRWFHKWVAKAIVPSGGSSVAAANNLSKRPRRSLLASLASLHHLTSLSFDVSGPSTMGCAIVHDDPPVYLDPTPVADLVAAFPALETASLSGLFSRPGWDELQYSEDRAAMLTASGLRPRSPKEFWREMSQVWEKCGPALQTLEMRRVPGRERQAEPLVWHRGDPEPTTSLDEVVAPSVSSVD